MLRRDDGSAAVDFVLVAGLTTVLFMAVVQLTLGLHVRNTLVDCAGEGARYAARADRSLADGEQRTRELIATALAPSFAGEVSARVVVRGGVDVVEVQVRAPLPVIGLIGPGGGITVLGHGLDEGE